MVQIKVLISGGGIAGNALGFWLSRSGHDVTIVERHSDLRTSGLQIDLRGHGIEVLRRMGLEQEFRSLSAPEEGWQIVNSSGKSRAYFPANKSGKGTQSLTSDFEIMRGDLVRLLYRSNQSCVKYQFGTSIQSFKNEPDGVEVRFADGTTGVYDLLVGADGQWSGTRRMMLGPGTSDTFIPIVPLSYTAYFTTIQPIQEGEKYLATLYLASGGRGIMTRRHSPSEIQVYLGCNDNPRPLLSVHRGDIPGEKAAMREIFQGAGWQTEKLLQAMDKADDFYCERLGLIKMKSWSENRVVLLGDAAYCPSVNTGMGTTSSFVGAYILAGEIDKHCGGSQTSTAEWEKVHTCPNREALLAALRAYEAKFRPFMNQVQEGVLEGSGPFPKSPIGVAAFNTLARIAAALRLNPFGFTAKETVKNWKLPDYGLTLKASQQKAVTCGTQRDT